MDPKSIIITGSSRGIGKELARYFLNLGHHLVINGRNEEILESTLAEFKLLKGSSVGIAGDVSKEITHKALFQLALDHFGKVDIYINNAGIPQGHKNFNDLKSSLIVNLININLSGLMLGTKVAIDRMKQQGFGKIFNMGGFGSDGRTLEKLTLYGTSKRAVNYFTKSMAKELKDSTIQIGLINPGMVLTDFINISMDEGTKEEKEQFKKVKRIMAEPPEKVVPFIGERILKSSKHYDRILYLSGWKLFVKITKMILS